MEHRLSNSNYSHLLQRSYSLAVWIKNDVDTYRVFGRNKYLKDKSVILPRYQAQALLFLSTPNLPKKVLFFQDTSSFKVTLLVPLALDLRISNWSEVDGTPQREAKVL